MPATVSQLTARALEIRRAFDRSNTAAGRRPWTPVEIAQGFAGDVGSLTKLAMMQAGLRGKTADLPARLEHELADCLWSVLVLAHAYGIDLESAFVRTMDDLDRGLAR